MMLSERDQIVGKFNGHLGSCLLLQAEEAIWAGDHRATNKLKDLITNDEMELEYKGKEPIRVNNYIRFLVTSNDAHPIMAQLGERRWATFKISDAHKNDHPYFAAIDEEMNNGGYETLLCWLLNLDISGINLRQILHTEILIEQKLASMSREEEWWYAILRSGILPGDEYGCGHTPFGYLYANYVERSRAAGGHYRSLETQLGIFLKRHVPELRRIDRCVSLSRYERGDYTRWDFRGVCELPSLQACRNAFANKCPGLPNWEPPMVWQPDPQFSTTATRSSWATASTPANAGLNVHPFPSKT
jgi:hypothetical protein